MNELCCNGHGPNAFAILYLVAMAVVKAPAIAGMVLLHDHEQKPLLLTCLVVNAAYLFSWIVLWFGFTFKSYWDFRVLYQVQEFLNVQVCF